MLSRPLIFSRESYGSLYAYDDAVPITINAVDEYHAVTGLLEGSLIEGLTYLASAVGPIASTADNGSGILRCSDLLHGLTTGQYVTLNGMGDAAHVGTTRVTVVTAGVFDCDDIAYNSAADTGFWQRGTSLTIGVGHEGLYRPIFSQSALSAGANKNYKFELVQNITDLDEYAAERKIAVANDLGNLGAGGNVYLAAADVVWLKVMCTTTPVADLTLRHANISLLRH